MDLKNVKISSKEIKLTDAEMNLIGPDVFFDQCNVQSYCASESLVIAGLIMVDGEFLQHRSLEDFQFDRTHFSGVKFSGEFVGCDFGDWNTVEKASIKECDFSEANLVGCRFLNCDVQTISFPKWPCFTIVNPAEAHSFVSTYQWPSNIGVLLGIYTDTDPECVAVCDNAAVIAEESSVSLEDFRQLLLLIPGITIID